MSSSGGEADDKHGVEAMSQAEARRMVWDRLRITAINDGEMVADWAEDHDEADQVRLEKACDQVAKTIAIRMRKSGVK